MARPSLSPPPDLISTVQAAMTRLIAPSGRLMSAVGDMQAATSPSLGARPACAGRLSRPPDAPICFKPSTAGG